MEDHTYETIIKELGYTYIKGPNENHIVRYEGRTIVDASTLKDATLDTISFAGVELREYRDRSVTPVVPKATVEPLKHDGVCKHLVYPTHILALTTAVDFPTHLFPKMDELQSNLVIYVRNTWGNPIARYDVNGVPVGPALRIVAVWTNPEKVNVVMNECGEVFPIGEVEPYARVAIISLVEDVIAKLKVEAKKSAEVARYDGKTLVVPTPSKEIDTKPQPRRIFNHGTLVIGNTEVMPFKDKKAADIILPMNITDLKVIRYGEFDDGRVIVFASYPGHDDGTWMDMCGTIGDSEAIGKYFP